MIAGADSIDDMALLRHGGMSRMFAGVRAPSTLGTFLRAFTFGHVRQLDAVASRLLVSLTGQAPHLAAAGELSYVDIDDTVRQTYGYARPAPEDQPARPASPPRPDPTAHSTDQVTPSLTAGRWIRA